MFIELCEITSPVTMISIRMHTCQIKDAIKEAAKDYDLKLSDDDIAKLTSLLMKLKDANIDWDSVINQAQDWASKLGDKINDPGFWEKLGNFFMDLWDKIKSLFS